MKSIEKKMVEKSNAGLVWAKQGEIKLSRPGVLLFLLMMLGVPLIRPIPALSAGYAGASGGNAVVPYATAVPPAVDLKSAPITVYPQVDGHALVTWDTLSHFDYDSPSIDEEIDPKLRRKKKKYPIPGFIKLLNGASVAVVGFMIPLDTNEAGDKATSFILARSQATCCYGITPKMNEWMFVQMKKGKEAETMMDMPVTAFGTLAVGEEKKSDTGWTLYRMVSDKVTVPTVNW
jgi:hypothetical protein